MKVLIVTGGTGGHIVPAIALADILKETRPETSIDFFGSSNRMEATVIPAAAYRFYGVEMSGMTAGLSAKLKSAVSLVKAEKYCTMLLNNLKPDIVAAFGNYISVPAVRAAKKLEIPVILHEQNSFAGKANRYLARYADGIACCYESNLRQFPPEKTRVTGNPAATKAGDVQWDEQCLRDIGLDPAKPFVVFMMGSLGSSSVSAVIDEACSLFSVDYQVVVAAGKDNAYTFQTQSDDRIKIVDYVDGKKMLRGCTIAVTRAGATTVAEIGAVGAASILIPSAYVANNHQVYNAAELVNSGAALMIEEKDLTPNSLATAVNTLMHDDKRRLAMKENARKAGMTDAAYRMIDFMEELVSHG